MPKWLAGGIVADTRQQISLDQPFSGTQNVCHEDRLLTRLIYRQVSDHPHDGFALLLHDAGHTRITPLFFGNRESSSAQVRRAAY
jgi:hypothetical protein